MKREIDLEKVREKTLNEIARAMMPWGNKPPFKDWDDFWKRDIMSYKKQLIKISVGITIKNLKKELAKK
jgi:hypothetical protein